MLIANFRDYSRHLKNHNLQHIDFLFAEHIQTNKNITEKNHYRKHIMVGRKRDSGGRKRFR